mgnify:CR=1 FL=1
MHFVCPHCHGRAKVRTSRTLSDLLKECYVHCLDPHCGHAFVAFVEVKYSTSPSARPRPGLCLPMSENVQRRRVVREMHRAQQAQRTGDAGQIKLSPPPEVEDRLLARQEVLKLVAEHHHERAYHLAVARGMFPKPQAVQGGRIAWAESDVIDWMDGLRPAKGAR